MTERMFKYYRSDFGELPVKVKHMDLVFDVYDEHTVVDSEITLVAKKDLQSVEMNAKNLEIHKVESSIEGETKHEYRKKDNILKVIFPRTVKKGEEFRIKTKTTCRPTKNILEGLYYDETPEGAPPTQITQCQQWGFQRIVPCFDDMTAKCTYKTTIMADERYTHMITNGDLVQDKTPLGNGRAMVKYDNTKTPMAPYLFFLGVGTYDAYQKKFVYPDGDSFTLELLVFPGSDAERAKEALEVLHDAVLWVHLFTGPERYRHYDRKIEAWNLMKEGTEEARKKANELLQGMTLGYKYTGRVYREIGMQNSDFGGMENVGNTTITMNRIMPFEDMTDGSFEYMIRVKVHEYYHNINGSEVTGRDPFQIWLNEAVTVHVERWYHEFLFGEEYSRLHQAVSILEPQHGTLILDAGPASMPIEPEGFNDTNELITSITYIKAPEVVRMIETIIGKEKFVEGLDKYHTRFRHSNATRDDWIEAMEEASGKELKGMMDVWLKNTGFPRVRIERKSGPEGNLVLIITQEPVNAPEDTVWEFPVKVALFGKEGLIEERTIIIRSREHEEKFNLKKEDVEFISANRGLSFYGWLETDATEEELYTQVEEDNDTVARFMALQKIADIEKTRIIRGEQEKPSERFVEAYFKLLSDKELAEKAGGAFFAIFESADEELNHKYDKLYEAKKKIQKAIAEKHRNWLISKYRELSQKEFEGTVVEQWMRSIKPRQVKNVCLSLLARIDDEEVHNLLREQYSKADNATDRIVAFMMILESSMPDKNEIIRQEEEKAAGNLVRWETFLRAVASNNSSDALEIIRRIEKSKHFRIEQANDQRALFMSFAGNKKKSLLTKEGREYLLEKILQLAKINEYSTTYLLKAMNTLDKIEKEHQIELVELLLKVLEKLNPEETPSVYNTAKMILKGSKKAVENYGKEKQGKKR
ncbi:DUF3458 domain-containing protein [Candidatus Woesearchaeota archaeon]|nr:MAG: DUF3458 domain-containing protein [Candidatus Woesearchaeota archaeon]